MHFEKSTSGGCRTGLALHLQYRSQPGSPGARGCDFGSNSVTQPYTVKSVTVVGNAFDCLQVHCGMPSNLDEGIAT
jgi:hypothetical protein